MPTTAGRYWIFCGGAFRRGGFLDYAGSYASIAQCINILIEYAREGKCTWWHIFDNLRHQVILSHEEYATIENEKRLELEDLSGEVNGT